MMKSINEVDVKGKKVLLRVDINSDVIDGKVLLTERIKQSAGTIDFLKKKGAKVIVIAHQGRPGEKDFTNLKQHADLLNQFTKIKFVPDVIGAKAELHIKLLRSGNAILLDNIRGLKDEFDTSENNAFVKKLSSWCNIYVNDAFSVSHRAQASVVGFPKHMPSYSGPLLDKEVNALKKVNLQEALYILAGSKPAEDIKLINGKNKVLACGLFGQMCLVASGKDLGAQNKFLQTNITDYDKNLQALQEVLKKNKKMVMMPVDFGVKDETGKRKDIPLKKFPVNYEIFDIGPETQKKYVEEISKANSVYMKGPAGFYTDDQFFTGTMAILDAVSKSKGFSLLGGGQLSNAIAKSKITDDKFGYISLSGGALLDYIAGAKLPGLDALGFYTQ